MWDVRCEVRMVVPVTVMVFQDVVCSRDIYAFGISTPSALVEQFLNLVDRIDMLSWNIAN